MKAIRCKRARPGRGGQDVTKWYQSRLSRFHSCAGMVRMAGVDPEWSHSMAHALALDTRTWPRGDVPGLGLTDCHALALDTRTWPRGDVPGLTDEDVSVLRG